MAAFATTTTTSRSAVSARPAAIPIRRSGVNQQKEDGIPNFNLGATLKPLPNGSVYVAYATSSNPVGAEFDGTSSQYGGLAPFLPGNPNQLFGPEKNKAIEVGTKWELFDRRLLVTGGAVPDREGKCAGIAEHQQLRRLPRH